MFLFLVITGNPTIDPVFNLPFDSARVMAMRLGFATLAVVIVGLERAANNQAAGVRTHMVLALGACGIMILSMILPLRFVDYSNSGDPGRMAAQVIGGIGFLRGDAILKFVFNIRGLTTAASIWTMSAIGLVFGVGLYVLGVVMTGLLFFTLHIKNSTRSIVDTIKSQGEVKRIKIE